MIDLGTSYLGLSLKNPLAPSASPLSRSLDDARRLEDAGAAALVMYSLFEEELRTEDAMLERFLVEQSLGHAEATGFMPAPLNYRSSLDQYLEQIQALKGALGIPVIASLNGVSLSGWVELGTELQQAGRMRSSSTSITWPATPGSPVRKWKRATWICSVRCAPGSACPLP